MICSNRAALAAEDAVNAPQNYSGKPRGVFFMKKTVKRVMALLICAAMTLGGAVQISAADENIVEFIEREGSDNNGRFVVNLYNNYKNANPVIAAKPGSNTVNSGYWFVKSNNSDASEFEGVLFSYDLSDIKDKDLVKAEVLLSTHSSAANTWTKLCRVTQAWTTGEEQSPAYTDDGKVQVKTANHSASPVYADLSDKTDKTYDAALDITSFVKDDIKNNLDATRLLWAPNNGNQYANYPLIDFAIRVEYTQNEPPAITYEKAQLSGSANTGRLSVNIADSDGIASVSFAIDGGEAFEPTAGADGEYYTVVNPSELAGGTHILTVTAEDTKGVSVTKNLEFEITGVAVKIYERSSNDKFVANLFNNYKTEEVPVIAAQPGGNTENWSYWCVKNKSNGTMDGYHEGILFKFDVSEIQNRELRKVEILSATKSEGNFAIKMYKVEKDWIAGENQTPVYDSAAPLDTFRMVSNTGKSLYADVEPAVVNGNEICYDQKIDITNIVKTNLAEGDSVTRLILLPNDMYTNYSAGNFILRAEYTDNYLPDVSYDKARFSGEDSTGRLSVSVTDDDGLASVSFAIDGGEAVAPTAGEEGVYYTDINPSELSGGAHTLAVTAVDTRGAEVHRNYSFDIIKKMLYTAAINNSTAIYVKTPSGEKTAGIYKKGDQNIYSQYNYVYRCTPGSFESCEGILFDVNLSEIPANDIRKVSILGLAKGEEIKLPEIAAYEVTEPWTEGAEQKPSCGDTPAFIVRYASKEQTYNNIDYTAELDITEYVKEKLQGGDTEIRLLTEARDVEYTFLSDFGIYVEYAAGNNAPNITINKGANGMNPHVAAVDAENDSMTVSYKIDNGEAVASEATEFSPNTAGLADGMHTLTVTAVDKWGAETVKTTAFYVCNSVLTNDLKVTRGADDNYTVEIKLTNYSGKDIEDAHVLIGIYSGDILLGVSSQRSGELKNGTAVPISAENLSCAAEEFCVKCFVWDVNINSPLGLRASENFTAESFTQDNSEE